MKRAINFIIHTAVVVLTSIIVLIFILPILKFLNLDNLLSKQTFDIGDVIGILSLNIGILQSLISIFGIGIAIVAFINFTQIREKLEKIDKKSNDVDNALKEVKIIVEQHEDIIKNLSENEDQKVQNIENIVSNNATNKLNDLGGE